MKLIPFNIFLLLILIFATQKDPYYNKRGEPSSWGINQYIENNEQNLVAEYEYKIDSIYDVFIFAEDLRKEPDYDTSELGRFYIPDYIYITTEEKFVEYEFKKLSKFQQKNLKPTESTVKGVLFHELSHVYFYQTILIMKMNNISVSPEYGLLRMFPNPSSQFGSEFIEEGFCEYVVEKTGEQPIYKLPYQPETKDDLMDASHFVDIKYRYSVYFLRDFLDLMGFRKGLEIILKNRPPTYDEILKPELYFNRISPLYYERENVAEIGIYK